MPFIFLILATALLALWILCLVAGLQRTRDSGSPCSDPQKGPGGRGWKKPSSPDPEHLGKWASR